jgi:hypothetical protein
MNKQQGNELIKVVQQISDLATSINYAVKGWKDGASPWKQWYAWYPVTTISGDRVWGKRIYCRTRFTVFKRYAGREYATDFDLLKDNDADDLGEVTQQP